MSQKVSRENLERLVTTNEAAKILGISLQGVHYRIKNGQLKSIKQSGKTFVYISDDLYENKIHNYENIHNQSPPFCEKTQKILEGKDEQIKLLKQSIMFEKFYLLIFSK